MEGGCQDPWQELYWRELGTNFTFFLYLFLSVLYHYISFYLYLYIHLLQPKQHLPGGLDPDIVHVEEGHKDQGPAGEGEDRELFEAG